MAVGGVALIAGAGPGIGSAVARKFAAHNFQVCAARRNGDKLSSLVDEMKSHGYRCEGYGCDFRKEEAVKHLVDSVENNFGPITVAVHNIGANIGYIPIAETTARQYQKIWEMATFSAFLFGKEVASRMTARGEGTILFTGATASTRGAAGFSAFSSAKCAKRALVQSMARELAPQGIHVAHVIIDGVVNTSQTRDYFADKNPEFLAKFTALVARDGLLQPDMVAQSYLDLHNQHRSAWTQELDLRPWIEKW